MFKTPLFQNESNLTFVFFTRKGKKINIKCDFGTGSNVGTAFGGAGDKGGEQESWAGDNRAGKSQDQAGASPLGCPGGFGRARNWQEGE